MGLLSSTGSITRYRVKGQLKSPLIETIGKSLSKNKISDIDKSPMEKSVGWTSFKHPYHPDFTGSSFLLGTYFVFSLRVDKKTVPTKMIDKLYHIKVEQMSKQGGQPFLTKNEKKAIKEHVKSGLYLNTPATPSIFDLIWDYENSLVWFFTVLKSANDELEQLFAKSFNIQLIRLFPFTTADLMIGLTDSEKDRLTKISPSSFWR